ncbi:MAG TPA: GNAT family N-acetyltransferase [Polyangiaceae bacterium]|nr:GNAT family N-acetyltransferase [Polyangiaceae bacterium]
MHPQAAWQLIEVTDSRGEVIEPEWLARAEAVHRQLRPQLPPEYTPALQRVFDGGGRMVVASDGQHVMGLAVYRTQINTFAGFHLYVDDLITDEASRSRGVGQALLGHCEARARALGCKLLTLESGVQRQRAHRFYFREGLAIDAYSFSKPLV